MKVQGIENSPQFGHEQLRQGAALGCFDLAGANAFFFRDTIQAIEQNGFAYAAQPEQHHSLDRSLSEQSIHVGGGIREQSVAARQFRRLQTGSWRIGIVAAIHGMECRQFIKFNKMSIKLDKLNING